MGSLLAAAAGMRTIGLLISLLAVAPQAATDQKPAVPEGTVITSAQVTGFDADRLSPGLRQEIRSLSGTPLQQQRLDEIAARIEAERPRYVAAVRAVMEADGQARVFFVMGRQSEPDRDDNVNERYIVEHADITGVPDDELTQGLRDDLQSLVGKRLDSGDADRLQERLERELPRYEIARRIQRGTSLAASGSCSKPGRRSCHSGCASSPSDRTSFFTPSKAGAAIWTSAWAMAPSVLPPSWPSTTRTIWSRSIPAGGCASKRGSWAPAGSVPASSGRGSSRIGGAPRWTRSRCSPGFRRLYETRSTITPQLKFALSPDLSVGAGVSISELEPLVPATGSQMANAAVASVAFDRRWKNDFDTHHLAASVGVRAGTHNLESDLDYRRYLGQGAYRYDYGRHHVQATGMAGKITGTAPLFERFTLGDSTTLRGWDKYDIAPAGADRMFHTSLEYRYTGVALFLDVGSVWDAGTERKVRVSTGFGLHAGPAFLVVGFPLNTDNLTAVVTLGLRMKGLGIRW